MRDVLWRATRWLLAATILSVAAYVIWTQGVLVYGPNVVSVDPELPLFFRINAWVFAIWVLGLGLLASIGFWWTISRNGAWRRVDPSETEEDPALERAWTEVVSVIAPGPSTIVYLVFTPDEEKLRLLLRASGLNPFAVAPDFETDPSAPLRAFQTEEGLILWCGGRPSRTAAHLRRALQTISPTRSTLRGVVTLLSADALAGTNLGELAATYRAALREVASGLDVRCPLVVVIGAMETIPGFREFVQRNPADFRDLGRFGFSLSSTRERSVKSLEKEYQSLTRWYERKKLGLMADRPTDHAGNLRLHALGIWLSTVRKRLLATVEALANPDDEDPIPLAGCYFVADGEDPGHWAFAAATMRGRVVGDPDSARWSLATEDVDRSRRRLANALLGWGFALIATLWTAILWGVGHPHRLTWLALAATVAAWAWVLPVRIWGTGDWFPRFRKKP